MSTTAAAEPVTDAGPAPSDVRRRLAGVGRRLVRLVVSLFVLVTFSFLVVHLVPGDPVRAALGAQASPVAVAETRLQLGLDQPLWRQYTAFLGHVVTGHLGESIQLKLPVAQVIADRLPNTLALVGLAFLVAVVVAFPLGIAMAALTERGRRRGAELSFASVSVVVAAVPDFVLAVVLVATLAVSTTLLPVSGNAGAAAYVIPVLALSLGPAAAMARIVRVETLGVLDHDYVRTARAKRLSPRRVLLRHAVPNALTGSLTVSGLLLAGLLAGTVLVESVMTWPGLGPQMVSSIIDKDYPMVQGIVLVYGAFVLVVNVLVDLVLAVVDPRRAPA